MHLCAGMVSALVKLFLAFGVFDLYNTALDDVRGIALDQPVYHPGAADQADLPNGKGQERMLFPCCPAHFLRSAAACKAAGARQLAFQLLLIEPFAAKDLDGFCYSGQREAVFLQLRDTRNFLRNQRLRAQPVGCFVVFRRLSPKPQHDRLMESGKLAACKFPDGKVRKILREDFTDVRRQAIARHDVDEQAAQHECPDALHQKLLFTAHPAAALRYDRQIRRVQK